MEDYWDKMLVEPASSRRKHHDTVIFQRETQKMHYLCCEETDQEVPYPLTDIRATNMETTIFHLKQQNTKNGYEDILFTIEIDNALNFFFDLLKWGECFYRRDGNGTPKSLESEVAALSSSPK